MDLLRVSIQPVQTELSADPEERAGSGEHRIYVVTAEFGGTFRPFVVDFDMPSGGVEANQSRFFSTQPEDPSAIAGETEHTSGSKNIVELRKMFPTFAARIELIERVMKSDPNTPSRIEYEALDDVAGRRVVVSRFMSICIESARPLIERIKPSSIGAEPQGVGSILNGGQHRAIRYAVGRPTATAIECESAS